MENSSSTTTSKPLSRFNSATVVNRGKRTGSPRRFFRRLGFNSATVVNRGKRRIAFVPVSTPSKLQFGHGGEPWKTGTSRGTGRRCTSLQFGHGGEPWKTTSADDAARASYALQFGHGGEPWKTARGGQSSMAWLRLQFGHGGEPWKTIAGAVGRACRSGFNSATVVNRGKPVSPRRRAPLAPASIRPRW